MYIRTLVNTEEAFAEACENISRYSLRSVDTETTGVDPVRDLICGVCINVGNYSYYFPFRHAEGVNLPESLLTPLGKVVNAKTSALGEPTTIVGFNYKFDARMEMVDGWEAPDFYLDSMLAGHLYNENEPTFKMEALATRYVDPTAGEEEDKLIDYLVERFGGSRKTAKGNLWLVDPEIVGPYGMQDVETNVELLMHYIPRLKEQGIYALFKEVCEFSTALVEMEENGLLLDMERLEENAIKSVELAEECKARLQELAGYECNPNSPQQMVALLGTADTKRETLEVLEERIEGVKDLLRFRRYYKANGTYYSKFAILKDTRNVLHPNLNIHGTVSGRLSCYSPNLQAVTRGTDDPCSVRDVFIATPGHYLVEADYSQAELRVACHYAQVADMAEAFRQGRDIHSEVAKQLGVDRYVAKCVNFSFIYGIGWRSFSNKYHFSVRESKEFLGNYDKAYPGFKRFFRQAQHFADTHGYIRLYTGRLRHFRTVKGERPAYTKDAMNALIQGSVGEMTRKGITRIRKELPSIRLCLTVHDSVIMEIPESHISHLLPKVRDIMQPQDWCSVPQRVDFKVGKRWGALKEVEV